MSARKPVSVRRFLLLSGSIFFAVILFLQYLFIAPDFKEALKSAALQTLFFVPVNFFLNNASTKGYLRKKNSRAFLVFPPPSSGLIGNLR